MFAIAGVGLAVWLGLAGNVLQFDAAALKTFAPLIQRDWRNGEFATDSARVLIKGCPHVRTYYVGDVFVLDCRPLKKKKRHAAKK